MWDLIRARLGRRVRHHVTTYYRELTWLYVNYRCFILSFQQTYCFLVSTTHSVVPSMYAFRFVFYFYFYRLPLALSMRHSVQIVHCAMLFYLLFLHSL